MNILHNLCLACALLTLPGLAHADTKPAAGMNCPMMGDRVSVQKSMSGMMTDMSAMMKDTSDPAMKVRMQKMHEQMTAMMADMRKMNGMMGGGMMQNKSDSLPSAAPPAAPDDHAAHHPNQ